MVPKPQLKYKNAPRPKAYYIFFEEEHHVFRDMDLLWSWIKETINVMQNLYITKYSVIIYFTRLSLDVIFSASQLQMSNYHLYPIRDFHFSSILIHRQNTMLYCSYDGLPCHYSRRKDVLKTSKAFILLVNNLVNRCWRQRSNSLARQQLH